MLEFTAFYVIFSFCFVFPPSAFVSAGLTVSNILDSWLGSEDLQFIVYQLRRTSATILVHCLLPLGYFGGLALTEGLQEVALLLQSLFWKCLLCVAIILPILAKIRIWLWWNNNWQSHPLVKSLSSYANSGRTWTDVASEINTEFRRYGVQDIYYNIFLLFFINFVFCVSFFVINRIDKVIIRTNQVSKTVITNSWIIKVDPYMICAAHQNHVSLQLADAEEHNLTVDSQTAQYAFTLSELLFFI